MKQHSKSTRLFLTLIGTVAIGVATIPAPPDFADARGGRGGGGGGRGGGGGGFSRGGGGGG
ncbi:MAG TPA: hypothetical protein VIT45_03370, partial [Allosphingosinicella sp.]